MSISLKETLNKTKKLLHQECDYDNRAEAKILIKNYLETSTGVNWDKEIMQWRKELSNVTKLLNGPLNFQKFSEARTIVDQICIDAIHYERDNKLKQLDDRLKKIYQKESDFSQELQCPQKPHKLNNKQKEAIISEALETEEGRMALAQSMVEPIRRNINYEAVGRKLFMVDELPQGALARYERDVAAVAHVISRGDNFSFKEGEPVRMSEIKGRIEVPEFKIKPDLSKKRDPACIIAKRFRLLDNETLNKKQDLIKEQDKEIFSPLIDKDIIDGRFERTCLVLGPKTTTSNDAKTLTVTIDGHYGIKPGNVESKRYYVGLDNIFDAKQSGDKNAS